jgi:hypothetical protein
VSVKISYGAGPTTLTFKRGPLNFTPYWEARVHDNLSTSGKVRERVLESQAPDILISFDMPHLVLLDDLAAWNLFMAFALPGGTFQLYPWTLFSDYYNCVLEGTKFGPKRNAPYKYGDSVTVRILQDAQAPATPEIVLRRFYGVTP